MLNYELKFNSDIIKLKFSRLYSVFYYEALI